MLTMMAAAAATAMHHDPAPARLRRSACTEAMEHPRLEPGGRLGLGSELGDDVGGLGELGDVAPGTAHTR